jgi:Ca2+-binding EF-hand superfamily protein
MRVSKSIIVVAAAVTLPLAAFAGDKDKTGAAKGATSSQFNALDKDRDGRISPAEAMKDTKIVFSTADKNGDGYLDSDEYMHLDSATETMPTHPATEAPPK